MLMAVGDIMLGDTALNLGRGVNSKIEKRGDAYPFLKIAHVLQKGDVIFGNLEAVLSDWGKDKRRLSSLELRGVPEAVNGLKHAGFSILSLANNHVLQHGEEAMRETMDILAEYNINYVGIGKEAGEARKPVMIDRRGISIAFLSYSLVPDNTAYISIRNPEEISANVREVRARSDIVIVSLHWGSEYMERPSPSQVRLAHQIIDSGASLILGHHPHVLQGIEKYHGGIIAYSLGNFVFDMWQNKMRRSMVLQVSLNKRGIADFRVIPVFISKDYQPEILKGQEGELLVREIAGLSHTIPDGEADGFEESESKYAYEISTQRRWYRRGLRWYFLKNLYRYKPGFVFQLLHRYIMKKGNDNTLY